MLADDCVVTVPYEDEANSLDHRRDAVGVRGQRTGGSEGAAVEARPDARRVVPACSVQPGECEGSFGAAPSFRLWALYPVSSARSIGLVGQVAFAHWANSVIGLTGEPYRMESTLTPFFAGLGGRVELLPDWRVKPTLELGLGIAFQLQSPERSCGSDAAPSALLGLGVDAPLASSVSLVVSASVLSGVRTSTCTVSDGAMSPFAGWGYGLHAGLAFDFPGSSPAAAPAVAAQTPARSRCVNEASQLETT